MKSITILLLTSLAGCMAKPSIGYSPYSYAYNPLLAPLTAYSPYSYASAAQIVHAPALKSQYLAQDVFGQASYGHSEPGSTHNAVQDAHGNKVGSFSYVKPDGHVHRTDYVADAAGYRAASNDLPVGPAAVSPVITPVHAPVVSPIISPLLAHGVATVPAETPEVIAAKSALFAAHAHALARGKRSIYSPYGHAPSPAVDTPEVAAAKAAHFAEHAKRGSYVAPAAYAYSPYGAHAAAVVTPGGYLADTPEVAAAKAAHLAEKAKVAHGSGAYGYAPYAAAPAYAAYGSPIVTPSGYLADAPDVAHAKAAHLAEHAKAASRGLYAGHGYDDGSYNGLYDDGSYKQSYDGSYGSYGSAYDSYSSHDDGSYKPSYDEGSYNGYDDGSYHGSYDDGSYKGSYAGHYGYAGVPVVTPSGHLADTPEVAHAKAAHLAEFAHIAGSRYKRSALLYYGQTPASTSLLAPSFPYLKPYTYTSIVHGPHAVSYTVA